MAIKFKKDAWYRSRVFPYLIRIVARLVRADGMVSFIDYELIDPYSKMRQAGADHPEPLREVIKQRQYELFDPEAEEDSYEQKES